MQDLGTVHNTSRSSSMAKGVNADGDVVGYSFDPGLVIGPAFLYTDRDRMRDLGTLGGRNSGANDVNDNGAIVGYAELPSAQQRPFLYTPVSGMVDLNTLIDPTSGWTLSTAQAINNFGTIVGFGGRNGVAHGYRARRIRDGSAPDIEALMTPPPNAAGWKSTEVTVRWRVRDPESGIASSSGCETRTLADDTTGLTLTCSAANPFGGSSSRSVTVRIDKTPPAVTCAPTPSIVWPPNGAMVPVSIEVVPFDELSGANTFVLRSIAIDDPTAGSAAVSGFTIGTASTTGAVQAARQGNGAARVYSFTYATVDAAGWPATCAAWIVVPHDSGQ